jgi:hypothetical protein
MFSAAKIASPTSSGYNLTNSLRFRASASAYLNRTPSVAGNQRTFTWSGWVKRGILGTTVTFYGSYNGSGTDSALRFTSTDTLQFYTAGGTYVVATTSVFRDPASWYHVVLAVDTTQATAANTVKIYVNNVQQTLSGTFPPQNTLTTFNLTCFQSISALQTGAGAAVQYADLYLAEVNLVDGQQLTSASFGSYNSTTGVWQPAKYSGTYGTNGFYLPFTNTTSTTTLGYDSSGNGNNWTTNNISLTAGVTYDSMTDVPTLTSATAANFAVLNPIGGAGASLGINSGNLQWNYTANSNINGFATVYMPSSKWYIECMQTGGANTDVVLGFATAAFGQPSATSMVLDTGYFGYTYAGRSWNFGTNTNGNPTLTVNTDVMNFAIDITSGKAWVGKNGTWFGSGNPATGANPWWTFTANTAYTFAMAVYNAVGYVNFGQQPFTYTPPTGFVALNTYNLPTSTVLQGNKVMDATLYTGTGSSLSVTNASAFKPDIVWIKSRSAATDNKLTDSVRGVTKSLISNTPGVETTDAQGLTAFNTNGFTVGANTDYNNLSATYVAWQWQAGQGSTSSNTNGSITSTVSVNATAGFSIVKFTGTGANATVGHGLGVAPTFMIVKNSTTAYNWFVYHTSLSNAGFLMLNTQDIYQAAATAWNSTSPTSSVFSVGTAVNTNAVSASMIAYCWTPISGFSAFGSYTGNGSADGPFVYTGFKPKWILIKDVNDAFNWILIDSARNSYNLAGSRLIPNLSDAEANDNGLDIVSNGFKLRSSNGATNQSGSTFIYAAFASNPFKNSLAF